MTNNKHKDKPFLKVPKYTPQQRVIMDHLKYQGSITHLEAQSLHRIYSLAKRISELIREHGVSITKKWRTDVTGKRYIRYFINEEEAVDEQKQIGK